MTTTTLEGRSEMGCGPLSERFDEALLYASRHHRQQLRKGSRVPYMTHLMSVSALVLEHGGSEDQAIAALLHDAVEDAPAGQGGAVLADIRSRFGESVASIVAACSDGLDKSGNRSGTWPERKRPYVAALSDPTKKPDAALLVTAADKTHNGLCIAADLRSYGTAFWSTFNACEHGLLWYYTIVKKALSEQLPGSTLAEALNRGVDEPVAAASTNRADVPESDAALRLPRRVIELADARCPEYEALRRAHRVDPAYGRWIPRTGDQLPPGNDAGGHS
jgi:hypothetical protein